MSKYFEVEVSKYTLLTSKIEVKVSKSKYATSKFEVFQSRSRSVSKSKPKLQVRIIISTMKERLTHKNLTLVWRRYSLIDAADELGYWGELEKIAHFKALQFFLQTFSKRSSFSEANWKS